VNGIIRWLTEHPVAANLLMVTVLVLGLSSAGSLTQKTFPDFSLDVVDISVVYPGASPAEIAQSVVRPIEDRLAGIDGIDEINGVARENVGRVSVSLLLGEDVAEKLDKIKTEIDRIDTFPEDAESPLVVRQEQRERALEIVLHGDASERVLKGEAERLEQELERLPGVSFVALSNVREAALFIELDRTALAASGLTLDEVARAVSANSLELPGGTLDTVTLDIPLRTLGRNYRRADFEDIVVATGDDGARVRLGDIARIVDGFEDVDLAATFDGKPSVTVGVFRVGDEQVLDIVEQSIAWLDGSFVASLPPGLGATVWQNDAKDLQGRIDLLARNAAIGLALVMLCLTLFLDVRLAAWAAAGIGISFVAAFIVMDIAGLTINMISLFGFILAIGIVVDNAIVIGESVFTHAERGVPATEAAVLGTQRMAIPVIFSALTTVVAFTPLLQLPGLLGKFLGDIPTIVIIVLMLSLAQSLLILPRNLAGVNFSPDHRPNVVLRLLARVRGVIDRALRRFTDGPLDAALAFATRRWAVPLAIVVTMMVLTVGLLKHGYVKFSFFPSIEGSLVTVDLEMADGTAYARTALVAERVRLAAERAGVTLAERVDLSPETIIEGVQAVVGQGAFTQGPNGGPGTIGGNFANVAVKLLDAELRIPPHRFRTSDFEALWRAEIGDVTGLKQLTLSSNVVNAGDPIALELSLPDGQDVRPVIDDIIAELQGVAGIRELRDDASTGRLEYALELLPAARSYGIDLSMLAGQVRAGFFGIEATRVQRGDDDVAVTVRLSEQDRDDVEDIHDLRVSTRSGDLLPLSSVARLVEARAPSEIVRRDGRTITSVIGEVDTATITASEANGWIRENLVGRLEARYPGLIIEFGGEQRTQGDAGAALGKAFAGALFVIFALLALIFRSWVQPLVVMAAIPLGLIGAVAGHLIVGIPLGLLSIFGIIGLSGVVINNSLVMLDRYNEYLADGYGTRRAVIDGTKERFRPILLTSVTTFLGIYPLILETSIQAQFLVPLAVSIGYGVLFGTLIILLVVPSLYIAQSKLFRTYIADDEAAKPTGIGRDAPTRSKRFDVDEAGEGLAT